jgi:hypothetical protein
LPGTNQRLRPLQAYTYTTRFGSGRPRLAEEDRNGF